MALRLTPIPQARLAVDLGGPDLRPQQVPLENPTETRPKLIANCARLIENDMRSREKPNSSKHSTYDFLIENEFRSSTTRKSVRNSALSASVARRDAEAEPRPSSRAQKVFRRGVSTREAGLIQRGKAKRQSGVEFRLGRNLRSRPPHSIKGDGFLTA